MQKYANILNKYTIQNYIFGCNCIKSYDMKKIRLLNTFCKMYISVDETANNRKKSC